MVRLRWMFVLLALLLWIPLILVVRKALASLAIERSLQHRAVVEATVDEMERELSAWLRQEEERPYEQYRYFYTAEGTSQDPVKRNRSPLAQTPEHPFILGYFQIDPDGTVRSPRWPLSESSAQRQGWQPDPELKADLEELETQLKDLWQAPPKPKPQRKKEPVARAQAPPRKGTTTATEAPVKKTAPAAAMAKKPIDQESQAAADLPEQKTAAPEQFTDQAAGTTISLESSDKASKKSSRLEELQAYSQVQVLEKLNRGARSRQERPSQQQATSAANVYEIVNEDEGNSDSPEEYLEGIADSSIADSSIADNSIADSSSSNNVESQERLLISSEAEAAPVEEERLVAEALEMLEAEHAAPVTSETTTPPPSAELKPETLIDIRLEPMVGRLKDDGKLVLYRTGLIADQAFRQGMLLDRRKLIDWLENRVLTDPQLRQRIAIEPDLGDGKEPAPPPWPDAFSYRHRFAEPFSPVAARLSIQPLPQQGGTHYLYSLTALLGLAVTVGFFALYRMVLTRVNFAERRTNFVSAVSHELKTPLTAIRMYGEMLRDGMVPTEERRQNYYEILTTEAERLTRLVNNVLELSRLEKDQPEMKLSCGPVEPVLREVVEVLTPHVKKEGFTLELEVEPDLPAVRHDRDALLQVLFNLVDNALKYARDAQQKTIVLRCQKNAKGGIVLTVADHGPGVAQKHLRKIFEPFYRAENELTRTSKGTGIGLALVQGLVERMGGTVDGRNGANGGFEVRVSLPTTA